MEKRSLSSRPDISPIAAAISPILKNGTYSAPNIHFKKTYTHLREILAEFVWTNAEIDELIVRCLYQIALLIPLTHETYCRILLNQSHQRS